MNKIVITMDGGVVSGVYAKDALEYVVIDFDTEGADAEDLTKVSINGKKMEVFPYAGEGNIEPKLVESIFKELG